MQTLTEIDQAEFKVRRDAARFEKAQHQVRQFSRAIELLEPQVVKYQASLKLIDKLVGLAEQLDEDIAISVLRMQGEARQYLLANLGGCRERQERRLADVQETLGRARTQLAQWEG